jgi:outer membrane protein insertion porin family
MMPVDNFRNPHNGFHNTLTQDFAGLGGFSRYVRTTGDVRYFHEIPYLDDVVAIGHGQAGNITPFGGYQPRIQDNFNLGPSLGTRLFARWYWTTRQQLARMEQ